MKNIIFAFVMSFSFVNVVSASKALALESPSSQVSGVVEHFEAIENEAMVKLMNVQQLYIIKNLMSFPEVKLNSLMESQEKGTAIKLNVRQNQILDVVL